MNNQKTNNASMSEQELLTDLLHSERDAVKQYASNCTESGCENLRSLLINCMTECSEDQLAVFEQKKRRSGSLEAGRTDRTKPGSPRRVVRFFFAAKHKTAA